MAYHNRRFLETKRKFYPDSDYIDLSKIIYIPEKSQNQLVKCRILYAENIEIIEFNSYQIRPVRSLKIVEHSDIDYTYKYEDRTLLKHLFDKRKDCDDILIVKNGFFTDSYYANLVFEDDDHFYTPKTPLLKGVQRQKILDTGKILERNIGIEDLSIFKRVHLINAMIKLGECTVEVKNIFG